MPTEETNSAAPSASEDYCEIVAEINVSVPAFQNFLRIENPLNIKEVMNKTVKASFDSFDMSNMSNN